LPATLAEGTSRLLGSKVPWDVEMSQVLPMERMMVFLLQELTLHAMALVFGSRRFFARLFE